MAPKSSSSDITKRVYKLTRKQDHAFFDILSDPQATRILFDGGARSGKTVATLLWLVYQACIYHGMRILIARKFREHAKQTIFDLTLKQILQGAIGWTRKESDLTYVNANGSTIIVGGLDDQERVDKILGNEYSHIFLNEATQLNWQTVQIIKTRLSQHIDGLESRKLILDCNPKHTRHWLYKAGVQFVDPDSGEPHPDRDNWRRLPWTPYDNPNLPPDLVKALESLTGVIRRRMLKGEWCDNEGSVYEEFDEEIHVIDSMPAGIDFWRKIRGIDFGFTNPFVCLWGAIDGDGRLYIYREHVKEKVIVEDHAAIIKERTGREATSATIADHDAEDRATLNRHGIPTKAAKKDVSTGIQRVKKRLAAAGDGRPRLFIHSSCKVLISEFYDYQWEIPGENRGAKEEPRKVHDHCMDALRYMVMDLDGGGESCELTVDKEEREWM